MSNHYDFARTILTFTFLVLLCAILILIFINALRRTFWFGSEKQADEVSKTEKCVDVFAKNLAHLQTLRTSMSPGSTALVDLGSTNLETGLYFLQQENREWFKIGVPFEGERYRIKGGESGGKRYTVRKSFTLDVRPPTEQQRFDNNHINQDLQRDTAYVFVDSAINTAPTLHVNVAQVALAHDVMDASFIMAGREIKVQNCSAKFGIAVVFNDSRTIIIPPNTIRLLHLIVNATSSPPRYELGAMSN